MRPVSPQRRWYRTHKESEKRFFNVTFSLQEKDDILLVKCSDEDVEEVYGIGYLPRLIYFEDGVPEPYKGDEVCII